MKTLSLIIVLIFVAGSAMTQNTSTTDLNITSKLVGTWSHSSSTYPGGTVVVFQREFQLYEDGTGLCTEFKEEDTLSVGFNWEVQDSVIVIFVTDKKGNRIDTDTQFISLIDRNKMYLAELDGTTETGKVCCYRRTDIVIAEY